MATPFHCQVQNLKSHPHTLLSVLYPIGKFCWLYIQTISSIQHLSIPTATSISHPTGSLLHYRPQKSLISIQQPKGSWHFSTQNHTVVSQFTWSQKPKSLWSLAPNNCPVYLWPALPLAYSDSATLPSLVFLEPISGPWHWLSLLLIQIFA